MASYVRSTSIGSAVLAGFLALCLGAALLAGCSAPSSPAVEKPPAQGASSQGVDAAQPIRVAIQSNALSIPTIYAADNGFFSDLGLDVELSTFVNGADENKAIEKGDVDISSNGLASVYMLATGQFGWIGESDSAMSTVAIYMREGSAPTLVSGQLPDNPEVKGSAETLAGLVAVGPAGTMEEWVAVSYFSQFGLTAGVDYQYIEMDRQQAAESVIAGDADVFVATDVDYCRVMEDNGFTVVATGVEATGVSFNNGYLTSNEMLEERFDDLVLFLQAVYRAAEVLDSDRELWANFAYDYYRTNGKPATREDVEHEIEMRKLLLPSDFTAPGYRLGAGALDVGVFHAEIGALDDNQVKAIQNSICTTVLDDAFGITVKAAEL